MSVNVRITGLDELGRKLRWDTMIEPAVKEEVVAKVLERWARPRKKGAGARNNALTSKTQGLSATVTTTLHHPRRTGRAWQGALIAAANSMVPRVVRKTIQRIEAAWGA